MSDDFVFAVFKNRDATHIQAAKGLVSNLGMGLGTTSDTNLRVSMGIPFGIPTITMGDGAGDEELLTWASTGIWNLTGSLRSEVGLSVHKFADTDNIITLGELFSRPSLALGDGVGTFEYLSRASAGLWQLSAALQANLVRPSILSTGSFTFSLTDAAAVVAYNSASSATATIPPNSSVAFPLGTELIITAVHATNGQVTVSPGSGVTLEAPTGYLHGISPSNPGATLRYRKRATDTWTLVGSTDILGSGFSYQPLDSDLTTIASLTATTDNMIQSVGSAWASRTPTQVRTALGLVIGTNVQAYDADLTTIAGLVDPNADRMLFWDDSAGAYAYLTPGTNLTITGTTIDAAGGTPANDSVTNAILNNMAVNTIKGRVTAGTGDPEDLTATQAKTVLGLTIGTNVQAFDADLTTLAGLTATTDNIIQSVGSAWASRTPAQVKTALALTVGTDVQAQDADLTTIAGLTATTDSFMQAKGSAWSARTIAQVKTDLGIPLTTLLGTDTLWAAKGDLAVGTANDTASILTAGANGQILTTDSSTATGLKWAASAGGGDMLAANNLSDLASAATARTNLGVQPTASPTFTGTLAATGGLVSITDGTAAHGKANTVVGSFGSTFASFLDSGDTQASASVGNLTGVPGLRLGVGGTTAPDVSLTRTGSAAAAFTGVLTLTSPVLVTPALGVATGTSLNLSSGALTAGTATLTKTVHTPTVAALTAASDAITVASRVVRLNPSGSYTLTSAPTIADGTDGEIVTIFSNSGFNTTLQDQGTLASSNLRIVGTTFTLGARDSITLMYSSTVGDWIEIARSNVT